MTGRPAVWPPFTPLFQEQERLAVRSASGNRLTLEDGREILDAISSWWTCLHGHCHPQLVEAIAGQAARLDHVIFAGFTHEPAEMLCRRLLQLVPGAFSRVFLSDNGSTAVEVALKMAVHYWKNRGENRPLILAFDGAYHGDTFGAMAAGSRGLFTGPYEELLFDVLRIPFPETWTGRLDADQEEAAALDELDRLLERHGAKIAALIAEPLVQGAAGMRMARAGFFKKVSERCRAAGILEIYDEVMTGFGRTGSILAMEQTGVKPHFVALSKGITGGTLPLGATLISPEIEAAFQDADLSRTFFHGHSYAGNPIVCAAANASLDVLMASAEQRRVLSETQFQIAARWEANPLPGLEKPRSCGTILAADTGRSGTAYGAGLSVHLRREFLERGVLLRPLGGTVYVLPPYCTTPDELLEIAGIIEDVVANLPA